jgi:hypothetical protein
VQPGEDGGTIDRPDGGPHVFPDVGPRPDGGPADGDNDGIPDDAEGTYGTDPTMADTDHDGVDDGVEVLAGTDPARIEQAVAKVLRGDIKAGRRPALWDGRAAERIVQILQKALVSRSRARIAA